MAPSQSTGGIASGVSKLSIKTSKTAQAPKSHKKQEAAVADSWEDEDLASEGESRPSSSGQDASADAKAGTYAPPPTPISPTYSSSARPFSPQNLGTIADEQDDDAPEAGGSSPSKPRPEKTDAVARRMIASALGMKVPKQTEEQKAYDKAVREKERKRRQQEREQDKIAEVDAAKAKQAIWDN